MDPKTENTFTEIRDRLEEIALEVKGDKISLDAALDLYDEAVKLGMEATELLESMDENPDADTDAASQNPEERT